MGIYTDQDIGDDEMENINPGDYCFYCHEPLTLPAVYWCGCLGEGDEMDSIWLHKECVVKLRKHLLSDYKKI